MERCDGEVLTVAHYNIRSLRDKSGELEAFVLDTMPVLDVLCLTEHWLCKYETNFRYLSDFMVADCFTRTGLSRGGSLIMVRDSVTFESLDQGSPIGGPRSGYGPRTQFLRTFM